MAPHSIRNEKNNIHTVHTVLVCLLFFVCPASNWHGIISSWKAWQCLETIPQVSLRTKLRIHVLSSVDPPPWSWHMDHPHGWRQTVASLSRAMSAPHSWYPVVRLCDKVTSHQKDRSVRHMCCHRWQEAGSLRARQTPARRCTSARRSANKCLLNCSPAPHQSLTGGESQEDHEAAGCVVFSRT